MNSTSSLGGRGRGPAALMSPSAPNDAIPFAGPKPLRAITLRPGGRCGCTQCLADEARENELRDAALISAVYDLGVEQLRAAALDRVPAFLDAFEAAS